MSRTDDANVRELLVSRAAAAEQGADDARDPTDIEQVPPSSVEPVSIRGLQVRQASKGVTLADENTRARLIAEITRLIREPAVPENTRLAGLTLIGWLARRRPDEPPHAIGVAEALESERRFRALRAK